MRADDLREVLVAGRDDDVDPGVGSLPRQRADHVVGLDPRLHDQRPAGSGDRRVQGFDLGGEVGRHRRPVRLVLGIPFVAEGLALGIENAGLEGDVMRLVVGFEAS